ncbi:MAG: DPP IV N-terminal domain-containing protein [Candidatus Binataceae bacterium]
METGRIQRFGATARIQSDYSAKYKGVMMRLFPVLALLLILIPEMPGHAWAQAATESGNSGPLRMTINGPGSTQVPIAIPELKNLNGGDDHRLSSIFVGILRRDLKLSGYFTTIDPHAYIENSQTSGYDLGKFNFNDWSSINAEFLVKGAAAQNGNSVSLDAMLFDVPNQRRMMGKKFTGDRHDVGEMARRFADAVMLAVTGVRGPFDTKLAFVSTRGGRFKEVYTQWLDGGALFRVTDNPTINLFPSFDHGVNHLLYLSYKTMSPELYLADLNRKVETRIATGLGMPLGGALTPDGRIIAAISRDGHTNLYLLDQRGNEIRALTDGHSINVSPSVCAQGGQMTFTSDRSGAPQIYVMNLNGGTATRVTYQGTYNTTPSFSPDCGKIAYQGRIGGAFQLFVIDASGGQPRQLTNGGNNQSVSWSPDGHYLAFSSNRAGRWRIYMMQLDNGNISALTEGEGNDSSPSWSWWLGQ